MPYNSHFTAEVLSAHFYRDKESIFQFAGAIGWNNAEPTLINRSEVMQGVLCAVRSLDRVQVIIKFQVFEFTSGKSLSCFDLEND